MCHKNEKADNARKELVEVDTRLEVRMRVCITWYSIAHSKTSRYQSRKSRMIADSGSSNAWPQAIIRPSAHTNCPATLNSTL